MTDTQNRDMVGAYGTDAMSTPNLDRLAASGLRFNRAYTTCPLCTPARSAIFSGRHPQVNGAWSNNMAPARNIPLMGEVFQYYGYEVAYTGKWHLDGSGYFGDGIAEGGFPQQWWYDGKCYLDDLGPAMEACYRRAQTVEDLRSGGFEERFIWGHRVSDRAIAFLKQAQPPFLLVVSFDEPHAPSVAPPQWWEKWEECDFSHFPEPINFFAELENKPSLQHLQRANRTKPEWQAYLKRRAHFLACNSYIDHEIGRILNELDRSHADDTTVIYTSDHGDMMGAHGLQGKGPMMYEEVIHVPLIIRSPSAPAGHVTEAVVSHLDILPTMLELGGIEIPECLHGKSLVPLLRNPATRVHETVFSGFHRYAINHDDWGEFYPIRCVMDGRYKLVINLFDLDEFYDLQEDPGEMINRIEDSACTRERNRLHDILLEEMDKIRDPFRSFHWGNRPWRQVRKMFYHGGKRRDRPRGFPFEADCKEAR